MSRARQSWHARVCACTDNTLDDDDNVRHPQELVSHRAYSTNLYLLNFLLILLVKKYGRLASARHSAAASLARPLPVKVRNPYVLEARNKPQFKIRIIDIVQELYLSELRTYKAPPQVCAHPAFSPLGLPTIYLSSPNFLI